MSDLLRSKNIYLIGMPGSGKSTVGRRLSGATAAPFIDCDEEFERVTGRQPSEYIASEGEPAFRDKECEILRNLSKKTGFVIATGGGVIIREENRRAMKETGVVIYVKRDLKDLPVEGRILSVRNSVEALYEQRRAFYEGTADLTVESTLIDVMIEKILAFTEGLNNC
ncbi:MAG: shikimate kinase [Lachnospiraceae bacterium]|nr:shikimate kinase [Lachnospiraceae bacterium]MBR5368772.1 shikimate kinase [Lachnospiraceae bacterium]